MKSGTTNLMLYLWLHPRLRTTSTRLGWPVESRFFSSADPTSGTSRQNGSSRVVADRDLLLERRWRDYLALYPPVRNDDDEPRVLTFDKSPNYLLKPWLPALLHRFAPSLRLVVTLRNPTARAYSHFQHDCRNGKVVKEERTGLVRRAGTRVVVPAAGVRAASTSMKTLSAPCAAADFDALVRADVEAARLEFGGGGGGDRGDGDPEPPGDGAPPSTPTASFACRWSARRGEGDAGVVARGLYACQLERWLASFPREQLLALVFETFVASRRATLDAVAAIERFVGLAPFDYDAAWRVRVAELVYARLPSRASSYRPMLARTRATLDALYCDPNRHVAALLRRDDLPWPCVASSLVVRRRETATTTTTTNASSLEAEATTVVAPSASASSSEDRRAGRRRRRRGTRRSTMEAEQRRRRRTLSGRRRLRRKAESTRGLTPLERASR
mmetsp:Transcript_1991/g.7684  ORF Transcript_1991/g.7684 Transcript_1991/m.7684 type:complete len:445 (-) Transcript_1991:149-1483(-)